MKKQTLLYDKTEIILFYKVKGEPVRTSLTYDKIISVTFERCEERKLFKKVPSEKIIIVPRGMPDPIELYKGKEGEKNFEEAKMYLEKFCKDNRITFYNKLDQ